MDYITGSVSRILRSIADFVHRMYSSITGYVWNQSRDGLHGPYIIPLYKSDETAVEPLLKPNTPYDPLKAVFAKKPPAMSYRFEITSGSSSSDITLEPIASEEEESVSDETYSEADEIVVDDNTNVGDDETLCIEGNRICDVENELETGEENTTGEEENAIVGANAPGDAENAFGDEAVTFGDETITFDDGTIAFGDDANAFADENKPIGAEETANTAPPNDQLSVIVEEGEENATTEEDSTIVQLLN